MTSGDHRTRDAAVLLGLRLREHRLTPGLTLQQLSQQTGISIQHLSHIERGEKVPSLDLLLLLADAYEVTVTDLLSVYPYGTRERPSPDQIQPPADGRRNPT